MPINQNLQKEMERAHVTQYALERLSGVPQPTIQRILKGSDPKVSTVKKIADALHISPATLIQGGEADTPNNVLTLSAQEHETAARHSNSKIIQSLANKASPKTRALLQRLAEIDRETGLKDEHIELLEHLVSRYEEKNT